MFIEANPEFKSINIYTSTINALQKFSREENGDGKAGVPDKNENPGIEEWVDDDSVSVGEEVEEVEEATVGSPAPAKKRRS